MLILAFERLWWEDMGFEAMGFGLHKTLALTAFKQKSDGLSMN